mmetsp:Transcript_521/g.1173  ORF Transcript_521/g.1173 Transcript_521/m.1173 type:complete len:150 (+) Transcript_521:86-535(+)
MQLNVRIGLHMELLLKVPEIDVADPYSSSSRYVSAVSSSVFQNHIEEMMYIFNHINQKRDTEGLRHYGCVYRVLWGSEITSTTSSQIEYMIDAVCNMNFKLAKSIKTRIARMVHSLMVQRFVPSDWCVEVKQREQMEYDDFVITLKGLF